jgi:SARP family transcriptional regulator, regulator of embCAB operon
MTRGAWFRRIRRWPASSGSADPNLPRQYDDDGLVDINRMPGYVLAASLALTQQEVTNLIAARDKLGKFGSTDELRDYAELPPGRIDELRDLMIFS